MFVHCLLQNKITSCQHLLDVEYVNFYKFDPERPIEFLFKTERLKMSKDIGDHV